jgi:hypothetical protein
MTRMTPKRPDTAFAFTRSLAGTRLKGNDRPGRQCVPGGRSKNTRFITEFRGSSAGTLGAGAFAARGQHPLEQAASRGDAAGAEHHRFASA